MLVIVKNDLEVGLCGIPVQFRLEPEALGLEVLGVISSSLAITCGDTTTSANSIIPGIASINYYNITNGVDILIAEMQDPKDNTEILYSDTLKIETIGSFFILPFFKPAFNNSGVVQPRVPFGLSAPHNFLEKVNNEHDYKQNFFAFIYVLSTS